MTPIPRATTMVAWMLAASGCAGRAPEVIRLPPLELTLGPGQQPMLGWPTSPPAPVAAFGLERELVRASVTHPLIDYCVDPSGQVTWVEVGRSPADREIAAQARRWTFEPWDGRADARFCESALVYDDARARKRWAKSTIVVYLPIVPPVDPLPIDGSLTQAPARMLHHDRGGLAPFWDVALDQQVQRIAPGFGEIRLSVCVDREGGWFVDDRDIDLDWLPEAQRESLASPLSHGAWHFTPRLEGGAPIDDCDVEIRYAVWVIHHIAVSHHDDLNGHLNIDGGGFGLQLVAERAPWAEHGPIRGVDDGPAPSMIEAPSWLPPYELATTMPASMPTRSARVRFCVPAAGGHPIEVRVIDSDAEGPERAVLRLVAEGVARWRAEPSDDREASPRCGEVDWQLARHLRDVPDPRTRI